MRYGKDGRETYVASKSVCVVLSLVLLLLLRFTFNNQHALSVVNICGMYLNTLPKYYNKKPTK